MQVFLLDVCMPPIELAENLLVIVHAFLAFASMCVKFYSTVHIPHGKQGIYY